MTVVSTSTYKRSNTLHRGIVYTSTGIAMEPEEWDLAPLPDGEEYMLTDMELVVKQAEVLGISPSQFTEFAMRMPNKEKIEVNGVVETHLPFSFEGREYMRAPYDTPSKRLLLKFGRQSEKSTLLGNKCLAYACMNGSFHVLYVSPSNMQTKTFSVERIKEAMETSEIIKTWTAPELTDSVFTKRLINRSQITLRYAFLNADRTRGLTADMILIDEIQDILYNNIAVIEEAASHSKYKIFSYSGTPKSFDNPMERLWVDQSTQNEWAVPCEHHGTPNDSSSWYWNILGEANIGKKGLICDKCGESITPKHPSAQWVSLNPSVHTRLSNPFEGYHVPQIMVPWIPWSEILDKYVKLPRSLFYNEVLGLSYDSGLRPLTRQDIMDNCDPVLMLDSATLTSIRKRLGVSPVYMGVDWGCHDDQTRILTDRGFTYFKDLTDTDRVAQWDPDTREMTFVIPEARTVREWDKPLRHFVGKGLDMMLTDTHRMRVGITSGRRNLSWKTESCAATVNRPSGVLFPGYVAWKGEEVETFTLPGVPRSAGYSGSLPRDIPMDLWLEFLGYYLSEGGVCYRGRLPSSVKLSQRESVHPVSAEAIRSCLLNTFPDAVSEFPNKKTGDVNWTVYGKQLWLWAYTKCGAYGHTKRIPREFLRLSRRQLRILFDAMVLGDGSVDKRDNTTNGYYTSTSKGLCEDFQEICIKLGLKSTLSLTRKAIGNKKEQWKLSWSRGRDFHYKKPVRTAEVPYSGKVYCCKVPSGYIVTERNGRIAYQGNTGERAHTVMVLGAYLDDKLTVFYAHRFEGPETDPVVQIELLEKFARAWNVVNIGTDYGGGFDRNDALMRRLGSQRVWKYQYGAPRQKVRWNPKINHFVVHRTEVMSDIFNAIKRRNVFRFPAWADFEDPFGKDMMNIFSEYNEQRKEIQYKVPADRTDDAFHAIVYMTLVSMLTHPAPGILNPTNSTGVYDDE